MPLLTILSCKILQDEVVHILENDSSVNEALVVANGQEDDFTSKLQKVGISYWLLSADKLPVDTETYKNDSHSYTVMVYMVELALHELPKTLKTEVYKLLEKLSKYSSGILLFYGLCGNVFDKIKTDFEHLEKSCPVRILQDDTRTVDDCVGVTLGGCSEYLSTLKKFSDQGDIFIYTHVCTHLEGDYES